MDGVGDQLGDCFRVALDMRTASAAGEPVEWGVLPPHRYEAGRVARLKHTGRSRRVEPAQVPPHVPVVGDPIEHGNKHLVVHGKLMCSYQVVLECHLSC